MIDRESILKRIDELLSKQKAADERVEVAEELFFGATSLTSLVYGDNSTQLKSLTGNTPTNWKFKGYMAVGVLVGMKNDINAGLISSLEKQISGGFFGDFILMAKQAIDNGYKDVAAVLAAAAIEDSLKKMGEMNSIETAEKDMSEVINLLVAQNLITGAQVKIVRSYVPLRNKAFHAEWNKIDTPDVKSLIAFTEEFVMRNFS